MFKRLVQVFFGLFGFELKKLNRSSVEVKTIVPVKPNTEGTMSSALHRLKKTGVVPSTIVDIGAASGNWSKEVHDMWPVSKIIAFEPLKEQIERLFVTTNHFKNQVKVIEAVAGEQNGEIEFNVTEDPDGSGVYGSGKGEIRKLPVVTINDACRDFSSPFLIKLDTHGFEIPILNGASDVLKHTEVVIIEVYGFFVSPTAPLFHQLSSYMEEKGFRLFDIVDIMRRKKDDAFWQADAIYLKANHKIFSDNNYQ